MLTHKLALPIKQVHIDDGIQFNSSFRLPVQGQLYVPRLGFSPAGLDTAGALLVPNAGSPAAGEFR